jgi:hypothetical protein
MVLGVLSRLVEPFDFFCLTSSSIFYFSYLFGQPVAYASLFLDLTGRAVTLVLHPVTVGSLLFPFLFCFSL